MFDKAFFKFALGFTLIIAVSMCTLYVTGHWNSRQAGGTAAAVGE